MLQADAGNGLLSEKRIPAKRKRKDVSNWDTAFSCDVQKVTKTKPAREVKKSCYRSPSPVKVSQKRKVSQLSTSEFDWIDTIKECPVYHPSKEEFEDPLAYVQKIALEASKFGMLTTQILFVSMLVYLCAMYVKSCRRFMNIICCFDV